MCHEVVDLGNEWQEGWSNGACSSLPVVLGYPGRVWHATSELPARVANKSALHSLYIIVTHNVPLWSAVFALLRGAINNYIHLLV